MAPAAHHLAQLLALAAIAGRAEGHGRLTVPRARNGGDNGAVGGGPGAVHAFQGAGSHVLYQHGICGNAAGVTQSYNRVGDVQGTYIAGATAEFKVVITAHHVGYFELELCANAGSLSEECFTKHRLLREGCACDCPGDETLSCPACHSCRRWWKPALEGELGQVVTAGYSGPTLPGGGNLVPYEFTLRYVVPAGVKTSRGVLRWHYVTTNSCTSKSSAPEEFWNCADVAVSDAAGDVGAALPFDNFALERLPVENLVPKMASGELPGVFATCPEDALGRLLGVGAASEYEDLCGQLSGDGAYERCKDLSAGAGTGGVDCSSPPESGILCESQCSDAWFQCHRGVAYTKYVPTGTKCKDNEFVLQAECAGETPQTPAPATTTAAPAPTTAPRTTSPATTAAPAPTPPPATAAPAPTTSTQAPPAPTPAPTAAPSPTPAPPVSAACGACRGCLWSSGVCYTDVDQSYCGYWSGNRWCGAAPAAASLSTVKRHTSFRGVALIQEGLALHRGEGEEPTQDEL